MAEKIVFGEIDWNAGDAGSGKSRTDFMKLEQGTSTVRVMGNPHQYYTHWIVLPDGSKKKINSPVGSPELLEKLEANGFGRKPRWLLKVLDRADDKFKLLEIGSQIYGGIKSLVNNPKWGKVTEYDIDIVRGKPGAQPLYGVTPNPKEKLDAKFKQDFADFNESLNMDALTRAADPAAVAKMLGWSDVSSTEDRESEDTGGFDFHFNDDE